MDSNYGTEIEIRLWDYIDGLSTAEEKALVEKLLESDMDWQSKYHELLEVHQLLRSSELEQPSMRFSKNVMDQISRLYITPATKTYINKNIIRGIAIFFIITIVGFLVYGFAQLEWSGGQSSKMPSLDISKFFNSTYMNVFMMINVVLGLFLLDRYIDNKREKLHKEA